MSNRIKKGMAYSKFYRMKLKVISDNPHLKLAKGLMDGLWMPICKFENNKPLLEHKVPWAEALQVARAHQMKNLDHEVDVIP